MKPRPLALFVSSAAVLMLAIIPAHADTGVEKFKEAERLASRGEPDFAFLLFDSVHRQNTSGNTASLATFAIGEYQFRNRNFAAAAQMFASFEHENDMTLKLLAAAYLARCAKEAATDQTQEMDERAKELFSSRSYIGMFKNSRARLWRSPMSNVYHFVESVDRMEITLNGAPFYTIQLP